MSSLQPTSSRLHHPAAGVVHPHPATLASVPDPTSAALRGSHSQQWRQQQQHPPSDDDEDEQLRRLEEEILTQAAKRSVKWTTSTHQRWRQRILAVAAFKTEGDCRRGLEDEILALADALVEDDEGVTADAVLSRGGGGGGRLLLRQQPQGRRTEVLIGSAASSLSGERPAAAALSRSSAGSVNAHTVFTQAEEDEMDMIMGLSAAEV